MKQLTRDDILAAVDVQIEAVETPEWGEDAGVYVRGMTGAERDAFESEGLEIDERGRMTSKQRTNAYARFAVIVVCSQNGAKIFGNEDIDLLGQRSSAPLTRIWKVGQRLSGLGPDSEKELKKK